MSTKKSRKRRKRHSNKSCISCVRLYKNIVVKDIMKPVRRFLRTWHNTDNLFCLLDITFGSNSGFNLYLCINYRNFEKKMSKGF